MEITRTVAKGVTTERHQPNQSVEAGGDRTGEGNTDSSSVSQESLAHSQVQLKSPTRARLKSAEVAQLQVGVLH